MSQATELECMLAYRAPFVWGVRDCCLWAADVVIACGGRDYAAGFRGRYTSALGAFKLISRAGGLTNIMHDALGRSKPMRQACYLDFVFVEANATPEWSRCVGPFAVGVVVGHRIAVLNNSGDSMLLPASAGAICWSGR